MCRIHHICHGIVFVMTLSAAAYQEPEDTVLSYEGNEFVIGFTETVIARTGHFHYLSLYVTTSKTVAVNFNVTQSTLGSTTQYTVKPGGLTVALVYDYVAVKEGETFSNKGIHIKVEGNKTVAVYAYNKWTAAVEGYLALPCNHLPINEYRYSALTYFNATGDSLNVHDFILVVACEDSTNVSVSTELEHVELNKQQTYLIDSASDLSGVVVVSNKPIFFLAGHFGFRWSNAENISRNHLCEQIPPTATWGSFFLVADLPGFVHNNSQRPTVAKLRIISELNSTTVFLNCNTKPIPGDQYYFDRPAEYHEITLQPNSYCTIESNRPVLVMQYSSESYERFYMTVLPSTDQYCNHYVLNLQPQVNWITIYVIPLYYQRNSIYVIVDEKMVLTNWTNIYCRNNTLCGHYTTLRVYSSHDILYVYHATENAKIGVIINGQSYAYPGGLCVVSVHTHILPSPTMLQLSPSNITMIRSEVPANVIHKPGTTSTAAIHINNDASSTVRTPTIATETSKILTSIAVIQTATASISIPVSSTPKASSPKQFPIAIVSVSVGVTLITVIVIVLARVLRHNYRNYAVHHSLLNGNKLQQYLCSCRKPEQRHYDHEDETPLIGINALNDLNPITTTPDDTPAAEYGTSITEDSTEGNKLLQCLCSCRELVHEDDPETSLLAYPIAMTRDNTPAAENGTPITKDGTPVPEGGTGDTERTCSSVSNHEATTSLISTDAVENISDRLDQRPTLPELKTLKLPSGQKAEVISSLAPNWKHFGLSFQFDDIGTKLDLIEAECALKGPIECCTQMLKHWLDNNGKQPVSWRTFIELLEDCRQGYLAEQLKEALQS